MAQEVMVSFWRVISHNDGLTGFSNPLPPSTHVCARKKYTRTLLCLNTTTESLVRRSTGGVALPGVPVSPLNAYLTPPHNCASACKKGPLGRQRSEAVMKRDRFLSACGAYVFLCTFSQHGPGEQVVSHHGIWCAPR